MTFEFLQAALTGLLTGAFSAGTIYGVLKTELQFMRHELGTAQITADAAHKRLDDHITYHLEKDGKK